MMIRNAMPFKKAKNMGVWASIVVTDWKEKETENTLMGMVCQHSQEKETLRQKFPEPDLITHVISTGSLPSCHWCNKSTRQCPCKKIVNNTSATGALMCLCLHNRDNVLYLLWNKNGNLIFRVVIRHTNNRFHSIECFRQSKKVFIHLRSWPFNTVKYEFTARLDTVRLVFL